MKKSCDTDINESVVWQACQISHDDLQLTDTEDSDDSYDAFIGLLHGPPPLHSHPK